MALFLADMTLGILKLAVFAAVVLVSTMCAGYPQLQDRRVNATSTTGPLLVQLFRILGGSFFTFGYVYCLVQSQIPLRQ